MTTNKQPDEESGFIFRKSFRAKNGRIIVARPGKAFKIPIRPKKGG